MMGRLESDQGQLFYEFCLGDAVPEDHLVRKIDTALDLSWLRSELSPHYSSMGRPCGACHRQRDCAVDDGAYQPFRGDMDKQILEHERSPHFLKGRPPQRLHRQ
jgi:hypothetical protein